MYTLQILDRGQTFLHALDDRPLRIGSDAADDLRLAETLVMPGHAQLQPAGGGWRLVAAHAVTVNGRTVTEIDLALGDRIEIGRAVLVVGRTVPRAGRPEDVLEKATSRARPRTARGAARWLPVGAAVAVLGGVLAFALRSDGSSVVRDEIAQLVRSREDGQLDRARAQLARLRSQWADATDDRLQRLDEQAALLATIDAAIERLRQAVLDPSDGRDYVAWSKELQRLEAEAEAPERLAARAVRGSLRATIEARPKPKLGVVPKPAAATPGSPSGASPTVATTPPQPATPAAVPPAMVPPPGPTPVAGDRAAAWIAEADRQAAAGDFASAIDHLGAHLASGVLDAAARERLAAHQAVVTAAAQAAMTRLLADAAQVAAAGQPAAALSTLRLARSRFPTAPAFQPLDAALAAAEAQVVAAAPPPVAPPGPPRAADPVPAPAPAVTAAADAGGLAAIRAQLDAVSDAERKGDYRAVAAGLQAAAAALDTADRGYATRLRGRAEEAELLLAWHDAVAAAVAGEAQLTLGTGAGTLAVVRDLAGCELVGERDGAEVRLSWADVEAPTLRAMARQLKVAGRAAIGAAVLLYRRADPSPAEALLAEAWQADAALQPAIAQVLARGRGEVVDARGYTLGKSGFVSVRAAELQQESQQLGARLDVALRDKDTTRREALVDEARAAGGDALVVLAAALQREFTRQVARLDGSALKKQVQKLAQQRAELDAARHDARSLIYDEAKYFYPYKPPQVSSDRYAAYLRVQAEIERRTAAVRTLWQDDRTKVRVPPSLSQDLERLGWLAKVLAQLGELDAAALARVDWARALPPGDVVSIRDYCASVAERDELEDWRRVEAYNELVGKSLSSAQRELLRITNDYRTMFRHRPVAIVATLAAASQGHADEMSRLGYFSHTSPTEGRGSPADRTRLAGYPGGATENIALVDGAMGAHLAWLTSSGHHRNLLDPGHHEVGLGANGRYWVQNFSSGRVHRDSAEFAKVAASR